VSRPFSGRWPRSRTLRHSVAFCDLGEHVWAWQCDTAGYGAGAGYCRSAGGYLGRLRQRPLPLPVLRTCIIWDWDCSDVADCSSGIIMSVG
jgi:hypothetical protein